ncbi:unnamed protein product [Oikopleura dioica]|uniref:Uncharacterized protein n=1 Tax=Oikopleura dioica TaxID=34765 RepID=E4Y8G6_OIKDI|nr:unnamed protein product [Oikopleura dioica]
MAERYLCIRPSGFGRFQTRTNIGSRDLKMSDISALISGRQKELQQRDQRTLSNGRFRPRIGSFTRGRILEDSTRTNQPLQLRTRSVKPVTSAGHHHHTDYTIYYYNEAPSANPHKVFDGVQKCFAGARHKFLQVNITDVNQMGPVVKQRFQEQFLKVGCSISYYCKTPQFQTVLSAAAGVGYLRINRLRELTCGNEICYLQFYLLEKPAHKTADKELGLDEAFNYLQYQIQLGEVRVDMSNYVGYTAVFSADPNTLRTREMIDENVKYEDKYVIDGHSDGAFVRDEIRSNDHKSTVILGLDCYKVSGYLLYKKAFLFFRFVFDDGRFKEHST